MHVTLATALLKCAALTFEALLALLCIYSDNVLRQTSLVKQLPVWNNAIMDVCGDQLVRQDIFNETDCAM